MRSSKLQQRDDTPARLRYLDLARPSGHATRRSDDAQMSVEQKAFSRTQDVTRCCSPMRKKTQSLRLPSRARANPKHEGNGAWSEAKAPTAHALSPLAPGLGLSQATPAVDPGTRLASFPRRLAAPSLNRIGNAELTRRACRKQQRSRDTPIAFSPPSPPPSISTTASASSEWPSPDVAAIRSFAAALAGWRRRQPAAISSWYVCRRSPCDSEHPT